MRVIGILSGMNEDSVIPPAVHREIMGRLAAAERDERMRILLAIESGSRAWGFASPNSDFDVRFIFARPMDWYLAVDLEDKRDVIEYPISDDIDLNGWDVRKALRLFSKSNPTVVEWLQSPIQYLESGGFAEVLRALLPQVYSCESGIHHYRNMAKTTYLGHMRAKMVSLKKYFYVLRPLLSVRWIERYSTPAPIAFEKLLHLIADQQEVVREIEMLFRRKRAAPEMARSEPIASLNDFIEQELERLETVMLERLPPACATSELDRIFRATLREGQLES